MYMIMTSEKGTFSLEHIIYHDNQISRTSGVPMQCEEGKLYLATGTHS